MSANDVPPIVIGEPRRGDIVKLHYGPRWFTAVVIDLSRRIMWSELSGDPNTWKSDADYITLHERVDIDNEEERITVAKVRLRLNRDKQDEF